MLDVLALLTNKYFWKIHSVCIAWILRIYGIRVGTNFYCEGVPRLKIRGKGAHIHIGNHVQFLGSVDLRNRENGVIHFADHTTVEGDTRFVSAREGKIVINRGSIVCTQSIINGGSDVLVGENCIIGPRCSINANEHVFVKNTIIRESGFIHAPVVIEDDCWLAANVVVTKGVRLGKGSVVGANAVVTADTDPYSINVGVPARKVGERS